MYMFYVKQAEAQRAAKRALQDRTQIQRASMLKDPFASLVLNRQTGLLSPRLRANSGSIWTQHATRRLFLEISQTEKPRSIRLPYFYKDDHVVTAIVKDEATGAVFEGYHGSVQSNAGTLACVECVTRSLLSNDMNFPAPAYNRPHRSWPLRRSHLPEDEYPISSRRPLFFRQNTEAGGVFTLQKPTMY